MPDPKLLLKLSEVSRVSRFKTVLRIGGMLLFVAGLVCLPVGYGVNPKRDLNFFNNLADLGAFVRVSVVLVAVGLVTMAASCLVPGEIDD